MAKSILIAYLRELCQVSRDGTSISSMRDAAEKLGYDVSVTKMSWKTLNNDNIKLPCDYSFTAKPFRSTI